ncbi:DUF4326 domain-containing protein [Pseudoxanthomonas kaohsiungensis]|uniref:DUF4326 domain-containing protein n=1 Tax=Pseudoxanthomonas kaohsiungensis TaxID=283923 RepID=A0ABW3LXW3_9GAMM|nr:DUF4326 domain-containing protein [Pseudoxanthomonas kaohsiungensis]KAF1702863.1 hypothetical protein CSC66_08810 [Pseudoxanthomonas kaohsiungensis]
MPPRVFNRHHKDAPAGAVYIGRGTPWGNPFGIVPGVTRQDAVKRFLQRVEADPDYQARIRQQLAGRDLVCSCAPRLCHGDVLLAVANNLPLPQIEEPDPAPQPSLF